MTYFKPSSFSLFQEQLWVEAPMIRAIVTLLSKASDDWKKTQTWTLSKSTHLSTIGGDAVKKHPTTTSAPTRS